MGKKIRSKKNVEKYSEGILSFTEEVVSTTITKDEAIRSIVAQQELSDEEMYIIGGVPPEIIPGYRKVLKKAVEIISKLDY